MSRNTDRFLKYLYEETKAEEENQFRKTVTCDPAAAGSVYTAVTAAAGQDLHLTGVFVYNPGNAGVAVRCYDSRDTGVTGLLCTLYVANAAHGSINMFGRDGMELPTAKSLNVGIAGGQSGQNVEVTLLGYYD